jgi:hypothetical protein
VRKKLKRTISGLPETQWWFGQEEYKVVDGIVESFGAYKPLFRLDLPDIGYQLLADLQSVKTDEYALNWLSCYGFLTFDDENRFDDEVPRLKVILNRANFVRQLLELHRKVLEFEGLRGCAEVIRLDDDVEISYESFLCPNDTRMIRVEDVAMECAILDGVVNPVRTQFDRGFFNKNPDNCYLMAAKDSLRQSVNLMLFNVKLTICSELMAGVDDLRLSPQYVIKTPWQRIGITLMERICGKSKLRFCKSCKKEISGRADIQYCQNERCRKQGQRNRLKQMGD